jgi:ABC-type uncharacterized transport system permease subunit
MDYDQVYDQIILLLHRLLILIFFYLHHSLLAHLSMLTEFFSFILKFIFGIAIRFMCIIYNCRGCELICNNISLIL